MSLFVAHLEYSLFWLKLVEKRLQLYSFFFTFYKSLLLGMESSQPWQQLIAYVDRQLGAFLNIIILRNILDDSKELFAHIPGYIVGGGGGKMVPLWAFPEFHKNSPQTITIKGHILPRGVE